MVKINTLFVPNYLANKVSFGKGNPKKYIVIHQTGNTDKGADAKSHAELQYRGNTRQASWHETIDDEGVYQSFSHDWKLFHAGDGRYGKGNGQGIGIELCVNSDGNYQKTLQNAAERVKTLMSIYDIPLDRVISHYDCSKKWCPSQLLNTYQGISFKQFKNMLETSKTSGLETNLAAYLNKNGIDNSTTNRAKLAVEMDVVKTLYEYQGTTEQNVALLLALQASYRGKRVESIFNGKLRFYNKPSWKAEDVYGYLLKGQGFNDILARVNVRGYPQYKVSNGKAIYYVTAATKYVKVV